MLEHLLAIPAKSIQAIPLVQRLSFAQMLQTSGKCVIGTWVENGIRFEHNSSQAKHARDSDE